MNDSLFHANTVTTNRIIYTPSNFAKSTLLHLQEIGDLQATKPHTSKREALTSYLFFVVTKGSGNLYYDSKNYPLQTGSCVFIDCRKAYAHSSDPVDLWSLKWAHFYGPNLDGIYDKYLERGGMPVMTPDTIVPFCDQLNQLYAIAGSADYIRDMKINEKITGLLTLIMSESWHPESNTGAASKKKSLQNVKTYLEEHYAEHISLDQLAEQFFINKFYLTRVFKEQFGTTILSYLDHTRITQAKRLLRFSDMTVEEIGRQVGIEEPGYFNRVFKKIEGVTPGEYRKMW